MVRRGLVAPSPSTPFPLSALWTPVSEIGGLAPPSVMGWIQSACGLSDNIAIHYALPGSVDDVISGRNRPGRSDGESTSRLLSIGPLRVRDSSAADDCADDVVK